MYTAIAGSDWPSRMPNLLALTGWAWGCMCGVDLVLYSAVLTVPDGMDMHGQVPGRHVRDGGGGMYHIPYHVNYGGRLLHPYHTRHPRYLWYGMWYTTWRRYTPTLPHTQYMHYPAAPWPGRRSESGPRETPPAPRPLTAAPLEPIDVRARPVYLSVHRTGSQARRKSPPRSHPISTPQPLRPPARARSPSTATLRSPLSHIQLVRAPVVLRACSRRAQLLKETRPASRPTSFFPFNIQSYHCPPPRPPSLASLLSPVVSSA